MGQRSLKVIENGTIWKLGYVSYSPSIVTMAVSLAISEIFSVKEWSYLKIWVWGRSRSMKTVRFDRPYTAFYWSAIVTIALCCTVLELFNVEYRDLEIWFIGHSRSLKLVPTRGEGTSMLIETTRVKTRSSTGKFLTWERNFSKNTTHRLVLVQKKDLILVRSGRGPAGYRTRNLTRSNSTNNQYWNCNMHCHYTHTVGAR